MTGSAGKVWIIIPFVALSFNALIAQETEERRIKLENLSREVDSYYADQYRRALEFSQKHNIPMSYRDSQGNFVVLVGVAEDGTPMYEATDNAGAAITTGVVKLRNGGGLGLNLEGEGMEVGIWDGGIVDAHNEFGERILFREGSSVDEHATHVTGTILASGINLASKGMAPKAKAYAYDFSNDTPEMLALAKPDQTGTILSNHSYGLLTGWSFDNGWQWNGNSSISNFEDWRFGFYSTGAAQWDQLAYNAPYYLIVKSAGNDRSDTGTGSFPADCNGGSGYDCISDKSVAKNILTIGAVNKVTSYVDASSVVMSSFSSWGPTDDGRIKPDLVTAGVNLFSTVTNNLYGSLSGTSMAAPNATGSLTLLQELYRNLHSGNYMRAATLKALAIHTAKEAGQYPGPDYQFGWGLLDVEAAAKLLLNEDEQNIIISEEILQNGQTFELTLNPKANTKITATLAWTDPAGTTVGASLDPQKLMLVNDLDIRIEDNAGNEKYPWILNPDDLGTAATKSDNFRDNIEKIEFNDPEPRDYKLLVRHKGALGGGQQSFTLIVEYTSLNDPRTAYYWIGKNGVWNNGSNWSLSSGGSPAGIVPGVEDRVIVDENSFNSPGQILSVSNDASCHSIVWLAKNTSGLSLNNNTLTVASNLIVSSPNFYIVNEGNISFQGDASENNLNLSTADFSKATFVFDAAETSWQIFGSTTIGTVELNQGDLILPDQELSIKKIKSATTSQRSLDIRNTTIHEIEQVVLLSSGLSLFSIESKLIAPASGLNEYDLADVNFEGELIISSHGKITSGGELSSLKLSGTIELSCDCVINNLEIQEGSAIQLLSGSVASLSENSIIRSDPSNMTMFTASSLEPATLLFDGHFRLCFDHLSITKVNLAGSAIINAGLGSQLVESENWIQDDCEKVLFPDFSVKFNCINGLTEFQDSSLGDVTSWSWNFGEPSSDSNTSTSQNPYHTYSTLGNFTATLEIGNGSNTQSFSKEVTIVENSHQSNQIVLSGNNLFSQRPAVEYEWFKDGGPIPNSNSRTYNFSGQVGVYFVVTKDALCNRVSQPYIITSVEESNFQSSIQIYPNPTSSVLNIEVSDYMGAEIYVETAVGTQFYQRKMTSLIEQIDVSLWPKGLYFVCINHESKNHFKKIIIR